MTRATGWAGLVAVLAFAAAAFTVTVTVRADDAKAKVEGDLKKLQGTWARAGDEGPDSTWKFEGDTVKTAVNGNDYTSTIKLDEKASPHATIDFTVKDGPGDVQGKTVKGIYKIDGSKLVLCIAMPGVESRPADFKSVEDEYILFELKKE
jgi:uncharacterized protein (TIGR03067 family)